MYYIGHYEVKLKDYVLELPFEMDKEEIQICLVKNEEGYRFLIIDYIEDVQQLSIYEEIYKDTVFIQEDRIDLSSIKDYLKDELVCIGAGDVIELWNKDEFDCYCEKEQQEFLSLFDDCISF